MQKKHSAFRPGDSYIPPIGCAPRGVVPLDAFVRCDETRCRVVQLTGRNEFRKAEFGLRLLEKNLCADSGSMADTRIVVPEKKYRLEYAGTSDHAGQPTLAVGR